MKTEENGSTREGHVLEWVVLAIVTLYHRLSIFQTQCQALLYSVLNCPKSSDTHIINYI